MISDEWLHQILILKSVKIKLYNNETNLSIQSYSTIYLEKDETQYSHIRNWYNTHINNKTLPEVTECLTIQEIFQLQPTKESRKFSVICKIKNVKDTSY